MDLKKSITAYTDESGNTGNDLFNDQQPWFYTGTLFTRSALEGEARALESLLARKGIKELHANELGLSGLEDFAEFVRKVIVLHDCRFIFTKMEKRHYATVKLIDTLLDSGLNKAVSPFHHAMAAMRMKMSIDIDSVISSRIQEEFWPAYLKSEPTGFRSALERLRWNVQHKIKDQRGQRLLLDAINWAFDHPEEVLDCADQALASPNVIAVKQVLHSLNHIFSDTDFKVVRFVHDRQKQFGAGIEFSYSNLKKIKFKENWRFFLQDWESSTLHECELELSDAPLVGLQFIDVALWLMKRTLEGKTISGACGDLVEEVNRRALHRELSRAQLCRDAEHVIAMTLEETNDLDDATLAKARDEHERAERERVKRMNEPA